MGLILGLLWFLLLAQLALALALFRACQRQRDRKPLRRVLAVLAALCAGSAILTVQWMMDLLSFF